jgi:four helix bundle protein
MEEELKKRMMDFAVSVIRLAEGLPRNQAAEVVSKQLIRCATAVGANYRSACRGRSRADFISKLGIAEEEADEAQYWLEILGCLDFTSGDEYHRLRREAQELTAILTSSGKTAKSRP